jgi:phage host-nuclease inhibitor protein Gam
MMSLTRSHKPGRNRIDLSNDIVTRQWAKKLGKSKEEIAVAVEKVGDNCESVRKELYYNERDEKGC